MTARHRDLVARHRDLVATCATIRGNAARACQTSYFFLSHRSGSWVRELATARGPQKGLHWFVTLGHSPSRLPSSRFLSGKVFLMASDAAKKLPPHPLIFALFLVRLQHCVGKLFAGVNFQRPGASLALGRGRVHVGGRCSPKMSGQISKLRGVGQPNSSGHLNLFLFGVVAYLRGDVANNPYFLEGSVPSQHLRRVASTCV